MEQMNIPTEMQVIIDFESENISAAVKDLRPVVWRDGEEYCCLLGPDPQKGIFGCGNTVESALKDWETHLHQRIKSAGPDDEVSQYVKDTFNTSKEDIW